MGADGSTAGLAWGEESTGFRTRVERTVLRLKAASRALTRWSRSSGDRCVALWARRFADRASGHDGKAQKNRAARRPEMDSDSWGRITRCRQLFKSSRHVGW